MKTRTIFRMALVWSLVLTMSPRATAQKAPTEDGTPADSASIDSEFATRALEVTDYTRETFLIERNGLYRERADGRRPAFVWSGGVWFTALVAAARHEPGTYRPVMDAYFSSLDRHWDTRASIPGYEPLPTRGGDNDKYYDDNAWLVIAFLEAYQATHDPAYLQRADETLKFVLSGWDDLLGGGIWWHEQHKDGTKNVCVNAPAAVGCLLLARHMNRDSAAELIERAESLVNWTVDKLQDGNGLFHDRIVVETGEVKRGKLTYNTGLMIRAMLGLHRATGDPKWRDEASRIAEASHWFTRGRSSVYRDHVKWSHLLVEADLEMYRTTRQPYLLDRARENALYHYRRWQREKPRELITNAAIARMLWLVAETETEVGRGFWNEWDRAGHELSER